jgi:ABC-type transport system involved in multi-copper enzyme maturation permease subunit
MRDFIEVFRFECRYQRKSPLFLILAGVFALLTFLGTASDDVQIGGGGTNIDINASFSIIQTQIVMSVIGMLAAVALVAGAITRDYEHKTAEILFVTGVNKTPYLLGRFAGGFLFAALIGVAGLLGTLVATFMPWLDPERIGAFTLAPYVYSLAATILPNCFIVCACFFAAAALGRSLTLTYATAMVFLVAWIVFAVFTEPDSLGWAALADPFGAMAMAEDTRYWTVFERNTALPGGSMLLNRVLWVGVAAVVLAVTTWAYRFDLNPRRLRPRPKATRAIEQRAAPPALREAAFVPRFTLGGTLAQFLSQLRMDIRGVVRSVPFYVILGLGGVNVFGSLYGAVNQMFGTPVYPVTAVMLQAIYGGFILFVLMITVYYSGDLVHRERQAKIAEIVDAAPYPNGVMVLAKIVAMWFVVAMLLAVVMLTSIVMQLANGYTNLELGLYFKGLFGLAGMQMYLSCVLAVFIQVLASNKWLGMLAFVVVFMALTTLANFGFEHVLYGFAIPGAPYSDMNGYGHYVEPVVSVATYWAAFCVVLVAAAHLFFRRGYYDRIAERFAEAKRRMSTSVAAVAGLGLLAFASLGGWIYYNTNVLNDYRTQDDDELRNADYEKAYKQYELLDQPDVAAVDAQVDLFPEERRVESRGTARLVNATETPIEDLFVSLNPLLTVNSVQIDGGTLQESDEDQGFYRYRLDPPLAPGQTTSASWSLSWINEGFPNARPTNRVVANGTFVANFEIMPQIGYDSNRELGDNNTRRKHDLPPVERLPKLGDPKFLPISQMGSRQRTDFRAVVSTSSDQMALAPGYLQRDWTDGDRHYFEYAMDAPIWPFFSFSSARYEVARDRWNDVAIEIYHDRKHPYNVPSMIESTKRSLDYFTREFSPYQYRQFRVLEFPRYLTFAQSFPNTIPYSEAIGFVADLRDDKDIDYVFYITAHEMAHQWWAHQVIGARMQGMTVPVETLAQYSALMVMERQFGPEKMRRFLKFELDNYLQSRGGELIEELPLMLVENQPYIHYRKGSLVMYALKDLIGEDKVNLALRNFLATWAFKSAPFPTSRDLVNEFRAVALPEHQQSITDWFEKITLYDLRLADATVVPAGDGYDVTLDISAEQREATGEGDESVVPLSAYLDVGVFPAASGELGDNDLPPPLYFAKHLVTSGDQTITVHVTEMPARVGIDPYNKMVDRNPDDNLRAL